MTPQEKREIAMFRLAFVQTVFTVIGVGIGAAALAVSLLHGN